MKPIPATDRTDETDRPESPLSEASVVKIPATARAAVFRAVKEPQTIESFPIPSLKGSEVLVKIRSPRFAAPICTRTRGEGIRPPRASWDTRWSA